MDKADFKADVASAAALLKGMQQFLPEHIDDALLAFLTNMQNDEAALAFVKNAIAPTKK